MKEVTPLGYRMEIISENFSTSDNYKDFWRENMKFFVDGKEVSVEELPKAKFTYVFQKEFDLNCDEEMKIKESQRATYESFTVN